MVVILGRHFPSSLQDVNCLNIFKIILMISYSYRNHLSGLEIVEHIVENLGFNYCIELFN